MNSNKTILKVLIALGIASMAWYFSWWVDNAVFTHPLRLLLMVSMALYLMTQALFVWYIYLHAEKRQPPTGTSKQELSVDVFLPTFREPIALIENTLRSVIAIRYPHTTYVIDDGNDDDVRRLTLSLGAQYLRRSSNVDFKAGNINNALKESSGELVAIFDVDHAPAPEYLDRVLPYFNDPHLGVVQVALDHSNQEESFVAAAAGRMSDEFFAATMHGMDRMGCAVVFGSNAVFRRSALRSLGGYKPGLAEDLNTSIHLHAEGWKSAYLPAVLAKGLLPADLDAFYKQQFKWARGVFDVLIHELPSLVRLLTVKQKVCYATRMTYYLAGPVIAAHVVAAMLAPFFSTPVDWVGDYFLRSIPFLLSYVAIHVYAYRQFGVKPAGTPVDLRGALLVLASWPVYTSALVSALFGREPRFVSTPKRLSGRVSIRLIAPQFLTVLLLFVSLLVHVLTPAHFNWEFAAMIIALVTIHSALIPATFNKPSIPTKTESHK